MRAYLCNAWWSHKIIAWIQEIPHMLTWSINKNLRHLFLIELTYQTKNRRNSKKLEATLPCNQAGKCQKIWSSKYRLHPGRIYVERKIRFNFGYRRIFSAKRRKKNKKTGTVSSQNFFRIYKIQTKPILYITVLCVSFVLHENKTK